MRSAFSNKKTAACGERKRWNALDVKASAEAIEAVEHALNELGSIGTEVNQLRKKLMDDVIVTGYFTAQPSGDVIQSAIEAATEAFGLDRTAIRDVQFRTVEDRDWLSEWKKHWKPTEVGRFVIAPPWAEVNEKDRIVIRIEPNMAFGTGTHETTQLCLKAIDEFYEAGDSFLDLGTGTGILAIAAAKVAIEVMERDEGTDSETAFPRRGKLRLVTGSTRIFACDTDADSIAIARDNAESNGVGEKIDFHHGTICAQTPAFDFVCANLTVDALLPILPLLIAKSRKRIVLSGILVEQEQAIMEALAAASAGADVCRKCSGDWIAVVARQ